MLSCIDILVDGRFLEEEKDITLKFREAGTSGSWNWEKKENNIRQIKRAGEIYES